ncbi:MAG: hypothetical protein WCY09_07215 [Candidatus Omnitrophota bacterium]
MATQTVHILHTSSLQLFEENFSALIYQSENIIIRYRFLNSKTKNGHWDTVDITSVNGYKSPEEFKKWLIGLIEPSLANLYQQLLAVHHTYWEAYLAYITDKIDQLIMITEDERFVFHKEEFETIRQHRFKSFINCKLIGPGQEELHLFSQFIRFKAVRFAEVWVEVLIGTIDRIDLIHKLLIQSEKISEPPPIPDKNQKSEFNIKSNLTVPQLGVFFRLMSKSKVIDVPCRQTIQLIDWAIHHFQSKNREAIRPASLRNKFFTLDLAALDFWEQKLNEWLSMIREERNNILKTTVFYWITIELQTSCDWVTDVFMWGC